MSRLPGTLSNQQSGIELSQDDKFERNSIQFKNNVSVLDIGDLCDFNDIHATNYDDLTCYQQAF